MVNFDYNWYDFSKDDALDQTTGTATLFNYLGLINQALGTNMGTPELSALLLLHEFEHSPLGETRRKSCRRTSSSSTLTIYNDCIK